MKKRKKIMFYAIKACINEDNIRGSLCPGKFFFLFVYICKNEYWKK